MWWLARPDFDVRSWRGPSLYTSGVPRIDADTVAEHREQQHVALLDAAEALLLDDGFEALTFRALGERTGLARNSVYRYFSSRDDIVAQVCERDLPYWLQELRDAMAVAENVDDTVTAFVGGQLRLVATGHHRLAEALGDAPLGPEARSRIGAIAYKPAEVLEERLRELGHPRAEMTAQHVQGLVNTGVRMLHRKQADLQTVIDETTRSARLVARTDH